MCVEGRTQRLGLPEVPDDAGTISACCDALTEGTGGRRGQTLATPTSLVATPPHRCVGA